jgi:hypothetical protein
MMAQQRRWCDGGGDDDVRGIIVRVVVVVVFVEKTRYRVGVRRRQLFPAMKKMYVFVRSKQTLASILPPPGPFSSAAAITLPQSV